MNAVVIDPTTGLPQLPGGQWWEVARWANARDQFQVLICRVGPNGATEAVDYKVIFGLVSARAIRDAAMDLVSWADHRQDEAALLGAYPPKVLP